MTCREFADFMMDYLSDALPPETVDRFRDHLSLCVNCQHYLRHYADTVKLGTRAFDEPDAAVPADVPDDLVKAILAARPRH